MSEVGVWEQRMDDYYRNLTREQFIRDLKKSGFAVTDEKKKQAP